MKLFDLFLLLAPLGVLAAPKHIGEDDDEDDDNQGATPAVPQRIRIDVGSNGAPALVFTPNTTSGVRVGDIIDFHFIDENAVSSVIQGTADMPCAPAPVSNFFNSGPILGDPEGTNVFSVEIQTEGEILIYCGVAQHCKAGMLGVINPSSEAALVQYASKATLVKQNIGPPMMQGGTFTKGVSGGPVSIGFADGSRPGGGAMPTQPPGVGQGGGGAVGDGGCVCTCNG